MQSYCQINNITEVKALQPGMDFRLPQYRREVFLRFYGFHLRYKAFPGAVYYLIPHLTKGRSFEDALWFCFINGCTQNACTTYAVLQHFPSLGTLDMDKFKAWHNLNWRRMQYDTDRRYQKGHLVEMVQNYIDQLGGETQEQYFNALCAIADPKQNFDNLWNVVMNNFFMFGRLSAFSYLEYLKIAGLPIECSSLFVDDKDGSRSHRNGLCKVLGRDDMDWHKSNPTFTGYTKQDYQSLAQHGADLLAEAKKRYAGYPFYDDISYFTLESCLCTYKSMYRETRRYPNVYNDMLYERLIKAQKDWPEVDFTPFWQARINALPEYLRCEHATDTVRGVCPTKQNWFRDTGQVVMMDIDDPAFTNTLKNQQYEFSFNIR